MSIEWLGRDPGRKNRHTPGDASLDSTGCACEFLVDAANEVIRTQLQRRSPPLR